MTAIHLAAKNGHTLVIEILKEKVPLDFASPKVVDTLYVISIFCFFT